MKPKTNGNINLTTLKIESTFRLIHKLYLFKTFVKKASINQSSVPYSEFKKKCDKQVLKKKIPVLLR